ncbi:unnamed protein product [Brassica rapa]|uniref:Uncharacterized protein n=2 Tax=Brassica TaxID=3705 RepID=A0A8D9H5G9_BRACM|nr:unnamed protein product [Brassica napus]CAG7893384.1 unnamed protein product [Brassica rapa]
MGEKCHVVAFYAPLAYDAQNKCDEMSDETAHLRSQTRSSRNQHISAAKPRFKALHGVILAAATVPFHLCCCHRSVASTPLKSTSFVQLSLFAI